MASTYRRKIRQQSKIEVFLRREVPKCLPRSAEVIAFKAGTTTKAAEFWQSGHCLPSLAHALAMAQHEPHLRRLILEIINAEAGGTDE